MAEDKFSGEIFYGEIILPDNIHIAVGRQCNLWWSTVAVYEEGDRSVYFEVKCDVGITTARGFVLDAKEEMIGEHKLTVRSRWLHTREIISEKTVTLHIVPATAGNGNKNILMIGDSRTWHSVDSVQGYNNTAQSNKTITTEVKNLCDSSLNSKFTFLGTYKSELDENVKNLADNGWTYAIAVDFFEQNGGVRNYIENMCGAGKGAKLDYVAVMFGINDLSDWHVNNLDQYELSISKIDGILSDAEKLCGMILKDYPDCKIIAVLESGTSANQDGYGYWGASDNDCQQEMEFAQKALRKRMIQKFDNGRFSENIILSSAGLWCDRLYGFPYIYSKVSERAENEKVMHLINCVHPHNIGYRQITDGDFSTIAYLENK